MGALTVREGWRIARSMLRMGLTFGALSGTFFAALAGVAALFGQIDDDPLFMIFAGTTWGFLIGLSFSGVLAIAARGRSFDQLSLPRVAAVGAGGGLVLATLLVSLTWGEWPNGNWIVPLSILPMLGAASGAASLLLARRASASIEAGEEPELLGKAEEAG